MARLVIGVDVVGQKDVEALSVSLNNADTALRAWFRTSNAAGSDKLVAMSTATGKAFTELGAAALSSAKAVDAFFKGPNSTFFAREYGRAEAAVKSMEAAFRSLIATQAKQTMLEMPGVQRLLAEKKAIEANIAAYQKLRDAGDITGTYNSSRNYTSLAREFASEDAVIEQHIATLKAAEVAERQYASARNAALAASMERNLSGREALRQGAYAVSDYSQRGRDRLAAGSKAGGYDYAAQLKAEEGVYDVNTGKIKEGTAALGKLGDAWDSASKKSSIFHNLMRGASGAMGMLWMTYGQMVPMIAGFAAVGSTLKTVTEGSNLDYTIRSIQQLSSESYKGAENLELLRSAMLEVGKNNVFSSSDMAKGVLEFVRAGRDAGEAIKYIGEVSKFAYLGEMDLAKAVELVVGQVSAFNKLDPGTAVNTMAIVADKTSISLQQMTEALKNTTSLGSVMGLKFEDVAVAIGALGQAGVRGATAGAALTTMMYKLIEPTTKAQKVMASLGVSFSAFDTKGSVKSIQQIGEELAGLTKNLSAADTAKLFENLVGLRGVKALGSIVLAAKDGKKAFDDMRDSISKLNAAAGSGSETSYLAEYFAKVSESGKVQIDILKSSLDNLFASNYNNSDVVLALKSLNNLVSSAEVADALSTITSGILAITISATTLVTTFPHAVEYGIVGALLLGKKGAAILVTIGLLEDSAKNAAAAISNLLNSSSGSKSVASDFESMFNPFKAGKELLSSLGGLFESNVSQPAQTASQKVTALGVSFDTVKGFDDKTFESIEKLDSYLDQIKAKVAQANKSKLELLEDEKLEAIAKLKAQMYELKDSVFPQTAQGARDFNAALEEGKQLINNYYDGEMAEALKKDLKAMEGSWDEYANYIIAVNSDVVNAILQAAGSVNRTVANLGLSLMSSHGGKGIPVNAEVDAAAEQLGVRLGELEAKGFEKSLSKVESIQFNMLKAQTQLSRDYFSREPGFEKAVASADQLRAAYVTLGKTENDLYKNTGLTKAGYAALSDEQKRQVDDISKLVESKVKYRYASELATASDKEATKSASAGIKAENEALKQLRATITGYTNDAKDAGKVAGDWLKDNNSTLKNMDKLNKSFAEFSEFQPFTQIEYDANDMLAKYTDDLIAFKKEQEELPGLIDATGKAYDKARLARDGFAAGLAANGAGSTQEDINQLHAYDVAVDELDKDLQELTKRLFEMHNRSKSGIQDQEQLNKQMADTKAFRMQLGYYKELGKMSRETYSKIAEFVKHDSDLFEKATGDKDAANELFYQRMLDYQAAVARSERDITALMAVGFKKYKIAVDMEALEFYEDLLPRAIDGAADAMSDFWRNTVEGNMSAEESWRELGNTIKSVIYGIMQDLAKVELKNFIVGNASVSSGAAGAGGAGLSGLGGLFTSGGTVGQSLGGSLTSLGTSLSLAEDSVVFGTANFLNNLGTLGNAAVAGVGSLALSALTGDLNTSSAFQAGGAAIGSLFGGVGSVVGGVLGSLVGGLFGDDPEMFGFDPKRTYAGAWDTDSNMLKSTYVEPTTTHWSGDIFKAYGEAVVEVQKGFNTQVSALAAALPEEAADIMYNALAATNFSEILATASAGKWETADAEEAIKTATEKYSKGMLQALASAVGAGVTSYLDSYGTAGLVGDDKVWGVLTDAVQRNIETTFRTAASAISGGDYEGGLSQITQVQSAVAAISDAMAPITEIVETAGLTDYALQIRNINKQFDDYRTQLVAAGIDMAKFTDFEKARMLSLKKAADDMGGFAYVLDDLAEAAADALETAESALRDAYGAEQENLTKQHETVLEGLNNQLTIAQDAVSKLTSLTSSLRSTLERMRIESDEFARGKRQEAQATLQATLAAARRGELDPSVDLSGTLSTLSESSTGLFATFEEYQRDFWSTYLAVAELEDLSAKQLDEQETTVDVLNKQIEAENKWYEEETQLLTDQLNAILGLNTAIMSISAATAQYQQAATAAQAAAAQAAAASSGSGITESSYFAEKVAQLTAAGIMGTVYEGIMLNTVDDVKAVFDKHGLTPLSHWEQWGQYEGLDRPSFAVGTDYVPNDMTANIHKGERIVPAAYNRSDATNAELVDAINSLRAELRSQNGEIAKNTLKTARLLDTWDGDGMPEERVLA